MRIPQQLVHAEPDQSRHHQAGQSPLAPTQTPTQIFTCTFCWHISSQPPRILGSKSARLACIPCYNAILDLSICWVCGEVIIRGDECVSLGWCFWHRGCYGCLFCGCRLVVRGLSLSELFGDTEEQHSGLVDSCHHTDEHGRGRGREIDEAPLCANCLIELDMSGLEEHTAVQRTLNKVEKDGGLTRIRWEDRNRHLMMSRGAISVHSKIPGAEDEADRVDSAIYVSITDPIRRPAFRPSQTKPIPQWMQPFGTGDKEWVSEKAECSSEASTVCLTDNPDSAPNSLQQCRPVAHRGTSFVSAEPLKLPSSHLLERVTEANFSSSTFATYHTPPEYPSPTPSGRPSLESHENNATELKGQYRVHVRPPTRQGSQNTNPVWKLAKLQQSNPASPLTSSEYLERYQPGKAVSFSGGEARGARGNIVAKLRKTSRVDKSEVGVGSRARSNTAGATSTEVMHSPLAGSEVGSNKRRSVQAELKKFFGR